MTWTLRFYDGDGTEIGWVTADPFEVQITYPEPDEYEAVQSRVEGMEVVYGDVSDLQYRDQDIRLMVDPVPMTDPKAHLEYIHERLEANYDFTFSLTDE